MKWASLDGRQPYQKGGNQPPPPPVSYGYNFQPAAIGAEQWQRVAFTICLPSKYSGAAIILQQCYNSEEYVGRRNEVCNSKIRNRRNDASPSLHPLNKPFKPARRLKWTVERNCIWNDPLPALKAYWPMYQYCRHNH